MTTHLYLAPAGAGKTAYLLERARLAAAGLVAEPRLVVATTLQARAARRRLAEMGGAIGVRVLTFPRLYAEILDAAGRAYIEIGPNVQLRLIRATAAGLDLDHYRPIAGAPGFAVALHRLIAGWKAAGITPERLAEAFRQLGDPARLAELGRIYEAYQARLSEHGWADLAGLGWLAAEAVASPGGPPTQPAQANQAALDWPLVLFDGFDDFTEVQLALIRALTARGGDTVITLTTGPDDRDPSFRGYARTRTRLEQTLGLRAEPLPGAHPVGPPAVSLVAAGDRRAEVRAALRWVKARLLRDGMRAGEVAVLARDLRPYLSLLAETAEEFGIPLALVDGPPLRENPAVAALLDLLKCSDPADPLPRRGVLEAWRSPYFDWSLGDDPPGITPENVEALEAAARWGRVIGGAEQWVEALSMAATDSSSPEDAEPGRPEAVPAGEAAAGLRADFDRFVARVSPPQGERTVREFVCWLEELIGPDPELAGPYARSEDAPLSLGVVAQARAAASTAARDVGALRSLKELLRGLVWAEEALGSLPVSFTAFRAELEGLAGATPLPPPAAAGREAVLAADVAAARGLRFRAAAVLGLNEGVFPAVLAEDPFLRDDDRKALIERCGLPLRLSTESIESQRFHDAVTRPSEQLLLLRARLAPDGSPWEPSQFWETMCGAPGAPEPQRADAFPAAPEQAASWAEALVLAAGGGPAAQSLRAWLAAVAADRLAALDAGAEVLRARRAPGGASPYEGWLASEAEALGRRYGPERVWSASGLESYRTCPLLFFFSRVLRLEPVGEPAEGLDASQLGTIYHRIMDALFHAAPAAPLAQQLASLPGAARLVLDEAPRRLGFRSTAWWEHTRREIEERIVATLKGLDPLCQGYAQVASEARFGTGDGTGAAPPLELELPDGAGTLRLGGIIDRLDRAPDGRVRVIDYKLPGPWDYARAALIDGKKLQLPLYAEAARAALGLGEPADGFYWHLLQAEPSGLRLAAFDGGPQGALAAAAAHAAAVVLRVRSGDFRPEPPGDGCPDHCPAAPFCWRYRPRSGR